MQRVVALGATSGIVGETLKYFAAEGALLCLVGRSGEKLDAVKHDLLSRGAKEVHCLIADLIATESVHSVFKDSRALLGEVDVLYVGYGVLPDQELAQGDPVATERAIRENFTSVAEHLALWSGYFESQRKGIIAVISSVAGDRGRKTNYVYGSAKAGLSAYLSGLRQRLSSSGVRVVTIKPGFVDTPMTKDFRKGPLFASAATVGKDIHRALKSGRGDVVYTPWFWRIVLGIIGAIPETIFKRLSL